MAFTNGNGASQQTEHLEKSIHFRVCVCRGEFVYICCLFPLIHASFQKVCFALNYRTSRVRRCMFFYKKWGLVREREEEATARDEGETWLAGMERGGS